MVVRLGDAFAEALTASVGEGVYAIDLEGRLTFMNPAASAILGWTQDELLGVEIHDLLHGLDAHGQPRPVSECRLLAVARTGVPVQVDDDVFVHRNGSLVRIACNSSPIVADGKTIGAVVAFHDISEQKATEDRLRTEAQINETLLDIATTLNAQRDLTSVVQTVTDAGTVLSGAQFGAFFYNVVDEEGESYTLYTISGVDRSHFERFPLPRNTAVFAPTFAGERTIRYDDVTARPEFGRNDPYFGMPEGHLPVRSYLAAPVVGRSGEPIGGLFFGHPEPGRFTEFHERLVEAVAAHAGVAIENARRREEAQRVSETLQRSMLPRELPVIKGIDAVPRYLPAQDGVEVGGDWYDVVLLAEDRVAVVIGDVAGHNVQAASVMAEVRNAMRAYAVEGHSPSGVVDRTNRFLCEVAPEEMATCCYIELQVTEGTATVVLAGHPPPLVGVEGDAAFIAADPGIPLGVDPEARFMETTVMLPSECLLVLYTDGLVDQAHLPLHDGLSRLRTVVAHLDGDLETAADSILVGTAGVSSQDDTALLVIAFAAGDRVRTRDVGRRLPSDTASASVARRFIADVLRAWEVDTERLDVIMLLASEVVTNAVIHTAGSVEVRVRHDDDRVWIGVADESGERFAQVGTSGPEAASGRGLLVVDALSDAWGVEPSGIGKVVWFEIVL